MRDTPRYDAYAQTDRMGARRAPARALALAATATTGTWPLELRFAFIAGTAGLLWTALYGLVLALG